MCVTSPVSAGFQITTSRSAPGYGSGVSSVACTRLKIAVFAPMQTASVATAARVLADATGGVLPEESTGGGTSDARFLAPLGAQCIEVGPVNASIHKVDEHVRVADLERLPTLYEALMVRLLAP